MSKAAGSGNASHPYFELGFYAFIVFWVVLGIGWGDAIDGEVLLQRSGRVSAADNPGEFRRALIMKYGMYAVGALVTSIACAAGGLAAHFANRSNKT